MYPTQVVAQGLDHNFAPRQDLIHDQGDLFAPSIEDQHREALLRFIGWLLKVEHLAQVKHGVDLPLHPDHRLLTDTFDFLLL